MEKERYLNQLLDLIKVLKGPETDVARKHLKAYESNHTVNRMKMFHLYKYIKINEIRDYNKLKKRVSPDSTDESFNKLIRRTTERLQESLIVDVNIRRKGAYSDVFRKRFFLRKQIMQAQIIMGRGLRGRALDLFESIIRNAKKFELYDELVEALYFKQLINTNSHGIKYFDSVEKEIEFYENCRSLLRRSKKVREVFNAKGFASFNRSQEISELEREIKNISTYYLETNSSNIQSNYYLLKIELEKIKGNPVDELIKGFIELLENSPAVYSKVRIAFMYNELAVALLNGFRFIEAKDSFERLDNQNNNATLVDVLRMITYFKTIILLGKEVVITKIVRRLEVSGFYSKFKLQSSIIIYYQSVSQFLQKDYSNSLQLLQSKNEIEKDKEGWNVWIRIMRLLCSIEMLKLNMIDYDMESFRKYLERTGKQYEVRERDKLVLKVLLELDKNDYNFSITAIVVAKELEKLKSTDKQYAWNPDSPELILFHDWFEAKLLKKEYEPNFEVYREAMKQVEAVD